MNRRNSPTEPQSQATEQHALVGKVLDDADRVLKHRLLRVDQVPGMVHDLSQEIENHFQTEEAGGLFEGIVAKAPSLKDRVEELLRDHAAIRESFQQFHGSSLSGDGSDGWWEDLETQFEAIRKRLLHHEEIEIKLIQDAYLQDIGSMD